MANSHWDSLRELEDVLERYGRVRDRGATPAAGRSEHLATPDWRPIVDISETADAFVIEIELPGLRRDEVRVSVDDGVLICQGQREPRADQAVRRYHRRERAYGHFARSFALPETADIDRIDARCEDGVLQITIAKLAERRKRGVEIKVG